MGRYGHDSEDRHLSKSELATLRVKLGRERPARPSSARAADKTDAKPAEKPKARSAHQSGERIARPAMPIKQAIVRAVLSNPDASLADLGRAMDDLGYEISDFTLGAIKAETQYFIRQAEELGLFIRR